MSVHVILKVKSYFSIKIFLFASEDLSDDVLIPTFGSGEEFENIRLIAPAEHISCLNSGLIFRVLFKIVWSRIEINYKTLGPKRRTRKANIIRDCWLVPVMMRWCSLTQAVGHVVQSDGVGLISSQVQMCPHIEHIISLNLLNIIINKILRFTLERKKKYSFSLG